MKLVLIESPYAGDVGTNVRYAQDAMRDSLARGEAPFASHLLLTQVLDDGNVAQRKLGILAGLAWGTRAELTAVYTDRGISIGMKIGIEHATALGRKVEYRTLPGWSTKR